MDERESVWPKRRGKYAGVKTSGCRENLPMGSQSVYILTVRYWSREPFVKSFVLRGSSARGPMHGPDRDQNACDEMVNRLNVYLETGELIVSCEIDRTRSGGTHPKNARSLFAPDVSPPTGSSGTCSSSSVGKYDVSVIERSRGMNGASIWRIESQFTP